jgi:fructokinase
VKIISLGEILWDVFDQEEHLGGAPFNFAAHTRRLGHDVLFVSAVGDDPRGRAALERMQQLRLETQFVKELKGQSTGMVSVMIDSRGQPCYTIHRPAAYDLVHLSASDLAELSSFHADWIYYGTLHQMSPQARDTLSNLIQSNPQARRFYDVNLRAGSYTSSLVEQLLQRSAVVKLNEDEVQMIEMLLGRHDHSSEEFCRNNAKRYGWEAVCVTRGAQGCSLLIGSEYLEGEGYPVQVADTVGSGDAFAAAFVHGLSSGWPPAEIGDFANRMGALVASRAGAIPDWTIDECQALARPSKRQLRQQAAEDSTPRSGGCSDD